MDVLTDVLNTLRLQSTLYCRSELREPWGLYFGPTRVATFHVIDRGTCWLQLDGQAEPIALAGGDLIVLPRGTGHLLSSAPGLTPATTIQLDEDIPAECEVRRYSDGPPHTILLCGLFDFAHDNGHPLLTLLPPLVHIRGERGQAASWLDATLRFLASEAGSTQPGATAMVCRLTDLLFIQAMRAWVVQTASDAHGWLGALHDPQIGVALGAMHGKPGFAWTVEQLSSEVAMSRSGFAARFRAVVGESPLQYLTRWRMRLAAQLLASERLSIAAIAQQVGYESEIAFSKAFKRTMGQTPGAYRKQVRPPFGVRTP